MYVFREFTVFETFSFWTCVPLHIGYRKLLLIISSTAALFSIKANERQLLAWAFGDFEYVEEFTHRKYNGKNLPVRVYTTRGLKEQARFGLQNAHKIVDYFSEVREVYTPLFVHFGNDLMLRYLGLTILCPKLISWLFTNLWVDHIQL